MSEAYDAFGYDLGLVNSEEAAHFKQATVPFPKAFSEIDGLRYQAFKRNGVRVGVLIFPELKTSKEPGIKMKRAIERMCTQRRKETDLLIGISPWGYWGEQSYLKSMPQNTVDILLGSGPGVEVTGMPMVDGHVWWSRAYARGKHVLRIDIDALPRSSRIWEENGDIIAQSVVLTDGFVEDTQIFSIIGKALN